MKKIFEAKPFINKNNNQISFILPRREIKLPFNKIPKNFKFKIEEIEYEE